MVTIYSYGGKGRKIRGIKSQGFLFPMRRLERENAYTHAGYGQKIQGNVCKFKC